FNLHNEKPVIPTEWRDLAFLRALLPVARVHCGVDISIGHVTPSALNYSLSNFQHLAAKTPVRRYPVETEGHLVSVFDILGLIVVIIGLIFIWVRRNKEAAAVHSRQRLGLIVAGLGGILLISALALTRIRPLLPAAFLILLFGLLYWLLNRFDKT